MLNSTFIRFDSNECYSNSIFSLRLHVYLGPTWRFDYGDHRICPLPQTSHGAFTWEGVALVKPCPSLTFCNSRIDLSLWRPQGPWVFHISWAHLKRHGEGGPFSPFQGKIVSQWAALGFSQLLLGSIIWWVPSTAPSYLQLPFKKTSWSVEIWISPFSPPQDCVLWLPSQKAGPIFTYHFDAILGCNWKWVLGVEILTQSTKGWRELRGCTQEGLFPEASWLGGSGFLERCYGQQVGVPLPSKFLIFSSYGPL